MASATLVSVAEYLSTSYQPDCEYIDGILRTENPDIAVSLAEIFAALNSKLGTVHSNTII
jgi:hypothetical protein